MFTYKGPIAKGVSDERRRAHVNIYGFTSWMSDERRHAHANIYGL